MNSLKYFLLVCISMQAVTASNQMVIYWGQNSAGDFTNIKSQWEQPLRNYCEDSSYDIIVVGFVYLFPSASGNADPTLPGMNFANHCEVPFDDANPFVLNCTGNVAPDITYCQQRGKKIILSFGGGVGSYGFNSDSQAITFANTVWNMFLGGSGAIRPFGSAIFDGVDLDIEGGAQTGYIAFINTLRAHFATSGRQYLITAAPQCFYPDRLGPGSGTPLTEAWFDYIWIQFYNNHCGLDEFPTNFNFATWAAAMSKAANPNVKLFIGAPSSALAAASGFVPLATLQTIATAIQNTFPNIYGGIMVWDASTSDLNGNFGAQVASFVHASGGASTPAQPSTTGAKVVATPAQPSTTGAKVIAAPSTTGAKVIATPSTTGAKVVAVPSTTGAKVAAAPSTTGAQVIIASPTPAQPSTTGIASQSASGSCVSGSMKCLTSETYSTCARGVWGASQSCGMNTVCSPSGSYIYCVNGQSSTPSTPAQPVQPVQPAQPSTTGEAVQQSTPSTPSTSTGTCTMGYQRCAGSSTYQTCGNGRNGPEWSVVQQCQTGLQCHASATANNVYCY